MKTITITYDEEMPRINVIDTEDCSCAEIQHDNFEIISEEYNSDCEDFNDTARWLAKTLLAILKMEKEDDLAHCDWSADYDRNKETGHYRFEVSIKKIKELEK